MKTITVPVEGMTCNHCVHHVTEALSEVAGVKSVDVSLDQNAATLQVDDQFSEQAASAAVEEAGYKMGQVSAA